MYKRQVIHAPGSYLTYEPQWNSDVNSVYENVTSGEVYPYEFLVENCPDDKKRDVDYVLSLMDWEKNVDPFYREHYFRPPLVCAHSDDRHVEKWVVYANNYFGAKELTILPGQTVTVRDGAAYGCIIIQGHGQFGVHDAEAAIMLRFGQISADEYFVSEAAARAGVTITNRNQAAAVNAFVAVAGGIITRRSSKLNDNGTFDNTLKSSTYAVFGDATVPLGEQWEVSGGLRLAHVSQPGGRLQQGHVAQHGQIGKPGGLVVRGHLSSSRPWRPARCPIAGWPSVMGQAFQRDPTDLDGASIPRFRPRGKRVSGPPCLGWPSACSACLPLHATCRAGARRSQRRARDNTSGGAARATLPPPQRIKHEKDSSGPGVRGRRRQTCVERRTLAWKSIRRSRARAQQT